MSTIISCLMNKAAQNLVNSKTVKSVNEIIERLKKQQTSGSDVIKELNVADGVMREIEDRIKQKSRQVAISADLINSGLQRVDRLLKSGVPAKTIAKTIGMADEALSWKYGDLGQSTFDRIEYNTAIFSGMLTESFAAMKPSHFAMFRQPKHQKDVIKELFNLAGKGDGSVVSSEAVNAAKIAFDVSMKGGAALRNAGADLRNIKSFLIGYKHDPVKLAALGEEVWKKSMKESLDMSKVLEVIPEAADQEVFDTLLKGIYGDLVSGGNVSLGDFTPKGVRSSVNRRSHHRWMHPKDADSYMRYHQQFSDINIMSHLADYARGVGRDLGVLETLGPKPEAFVNAMISKLAAASPKDGSVIQNTIRRHAAYNTGIHTNGSVDPTVQRWLSSARHLNIMGKLGKTAVQAFTQESTFTKSLALRLRGLPVLKAAQQQLAMLAKTPKQRDRLFKELAKEAVYIEGFLDRSAGMARQYSLEGGHRPVSIASDAVMEYTGLNMATHLNKGSATTSVAMNWAEKPWEAIHKHTQEWLANNGVDEVAYNRIRELGSKDIERFGVKMVSPMQLYEAGEQDLASKVSLIYHRMSELVSPTSNPNLNATLAGWERQGKAAQISVGLFRTFTGYPSSWYYNHVRTVANIPGYGRKAAATVGTFGGLLISTIAVVMIYDVLAGKTPELNLNTVGRAMQRVGFIPLITDYIASKIGGESWQDTISSKVAGPTIGAAEDLLDAAVLGIQGEGVKAANKAVGVTKGFIPFGNAWFSQLILERLIFDQLRSAYDPKAHQAFRDKIQKAKKQGTPYYWKPGKTSPE